MFLLLFFIAFIVMLLMKSELHEYSTPLIELDWWDSFLALLFQLHKFLMAHNKLILQW